MAKRKIVVSFSMGKSSAVMCKIAKDIYKDDDLLFVCANTSWELKESVDFAKRVDDFLSLNLILVESVTNGRGIASTHKVVSWDNLDMNQTAFENMIKKYGIPNVSRPHCTRELKLNPIKSYLRSIGWDDYFTAIGFRYDEMDRVPDDYKEKKLLFPLINSRITKEDVYRHFSMGDNEGFFPFTLNIKEHEGNCQACFKKSDIKLYTLAKENPERFNFAIKMENKYSRLGSEFVRNEKESNDRTFYRKNRRAIDVISEAKDIDRVFRDELFDKYYSHCDESCEAF